MRVFAAGIGTPDGATILVDNGVGRLTPQLNRETGLAIVSPADFDALQALADAGRGRFVDLGRPGALSALADDFDALEATTFAVTRERIPVERFQIFAALALALLMLEPLAPALRRVWHRVGWGRSAGVQPALVGLLMLTIGLLASSCASSAFSHNEKGNTRYDAGDYQAALSEYRQAQADEPGERRLNLNAGRALHALGEFERAISESSRAAEAADATLAARAFFNLGNHRVAEGDLISARNAYIESLLLDPTDFDAKFNLELVNAALAVRQPPGDQQAGDGPPTPGQEGSGDPSEQNGQGSQPGQESDSGLPGDPSEGTESDQSSAADGVGQQRNPGDAEPGGLGQTPPSNEEDSALSAAEALQEALSELDRDAPTREQALAILDALRARSPRAALPVGQRAPISIDPEDR